MLRGRSNRDMDSDQYFAALPTSRRSSALSHLRLLQSMLFRNQRPGSEPSQRRIRDGFASPDEASSIIDFNRDSLL